MASQDLEENGIRWLDPAPGNDTYAIAASQKTSRELGVETISDLKRLAEERPKEATLCLNNDDDFRTRFDGLPGLERAYGFQLPEENLIEMSVDAVYDATDEAEICNFGVVFTTSGFILENEPETPGGRQELLRRLQPGAHRKARRIQTVPATTQALRPHLGKLDTETLRKLNYAVDVEGKSPENVAEELAQGRGLYRVAAKTRS